jgi:hypothetical protein
MFPNKDSKIVQRFKNSKEKNYKTNKHKSCYFCTGMKKVKIIHIVVLLMAAVFTGPQFYKTIHIFTDHHGHLHCEAMAHSSSGLNSRDDHCPICAFQFAVFDNTTERPEFFVVRSFHVENHLINETDHPLKSAHHFLLRAPPSRPNST